MQKATIVVIGTFRENYDQFFSHYSMKVKHFLLSKGAKVIRRQLVERTLYGDMVASLIMVIDFPTREAAETAFLEQEYLDLIPLRERVFSDFQMFLAKDGEV